MSPTLLPRASWRDLVRGRARLVGSRLDPNAPRGIVSPVEMQILGGIPYGDLASEEAAYLRRRGIRSDLGVVLRAALATIAASPRRAGLERRPWLVSAHLDNLGVAEAVEAILAPPSGGRARMIHFVHPHCLNLACRDAELADRLARADLVLPDGIGIRIAARLRGVAFQARLNGTDLWPELARAAAAQALPLVFVGGAPGVAQAAAERARSEVPGLRIPIVSHGYLGDSDSASMVRPIAALGRCAILVGMGSPRQEQWAWEYLSELPEVTALTVGGLFDFASGSKPRAPLAWRELGLEWLFRLLHEPRRLARRYLLGNPLFLARALREHVVPARRPRRLAVDRRGSASDRDDP